MTKRSGVTAVVLAGGAGSRLRPLTLAQAKPALTFAKGVRLIDFVLANLYNSGVHDICVLLQYRPESLLDHLEAAWRPRLSAVGGRLRVVSPDMLAGGRPFAGTADAVARTLPAILEDRRRLVGVFAADHVCRMDVRQMIAFHRAREAELSLAVLPVPAREASAFGVVAVDEARRVVGFEEKPARPLTLPEDAGRACVSMGNYLFEARVLEDLLAEVAARGGTDFGHHLLPHAVLSRRVYAYDFGANRIPGLRRHEDAAYWRDVGTLEALAASRRDVEGETPRLDLLNPHWPLHPEELPEAGAPLRPAEVATEVARA